MAGVAKMLKNIMKTSGWTQEQLAGRLGVSFASLNSWVNGRTKPRKSMVERIQKLYLAQDITGGGEPIYITLVNIGRDMKVGDAVLLEKDRDNEYDDEAIMATVLDMDAPEAEAKPDVAAEAKVGSEVEAGPEMGMDPEMNEEEYNVGNGEWSEAMEDDFDLAEEIRIGRPGIEYDVAYVANSVNTVARGTMSAGRLYDRFGAKARAQVMFVFHRMAIAKIVEWNYSE